MPSAISAISSRPSSNRALRDGRRVVYLRFGEHAPLLDDPRVVVHELDAGLGFESFASRIHALVTEEGEEVFYIFDSLSELLSAWATDLMIGNFFRVTCPYLFELRTVAYFALIRDRHSFKTIARIRDTTQLLLDVHTCDGNVHVLPLKVWERYSPTMFLPHRQEGERFVPLANSFEATNLLSEIYRRGTVTPARQLDHWHRLFLQAEDLARDADGAEEQARMVGHLCHHLVGRDERMLELARRHFSLHDLLEIKARMIGTGYIGGKAVGMLLARAILLRDPSYDWRSHMEAHDSFYVGSNRLLFVHRPQRLVEAVHAAEDRRRLLRRRRRAAREDARTATSPNRSAKISRRCSSITGSTRSSCAPVRCSKTASAMPSPASTTASFSPTREAPKTATPPSRMRCAASSPAP